MLIVLTIAMSQEWSHTPVIPVIREAEAGILQVQSQTGQFCKILSQNKIVKKIQRDTKYLLSIYETLG